MELTVTGLRNYWILEFWSYKWRD